MNGIDFAENVLSKKLKVSQLLLPARGLDSYVITLPTGSRQGREYEYNGQLAMMNIYRTCSVKRCRPTSEGCSFLPEVKPIV